MFQNRTTLFRGFSALALCVILLLGGCAAFSQKTPPPEVEDSDSVKAAQKLFLDGKMAEAKENWAEAIAAYIEALQFDPSSDEIAISLAKAFLRDGKMRSALKYTKMAVKLNDTEPSYWQILQFLEQQEGRFGKAAEALKMYMKLVPDYELVHDFKLAQYYFAMEKEDEAKKLLMKRINDPHTPASDMYEIASLMSFNGLTDEAVEIYNIILKRDPLDVKAWLYLGDLYSAEGLEEKAMDTYQKALEKNPDNLWVIVKIGNNCLVENDWDCALTYFEKAYQAGSEEVEDAGITYLELARTLTAVYYYAGLDVQAVALRDSLVSEGVDDARLYFSLGKAMNYLDRYEEAAAYYAKGFEGDLTEIEESAIYRAFIGYARALIQSGREEEALRVISEDAAAYISDSSSLKELEASIYMELKQYENAISIYEWLLASDTENRSYLLSLSLVYDLSGQFEKAEDMLLTVLDQDPEDPLALNNLAYMYIENDTKFDKAMKMVRQALIYDPENGAYLDTLGWAYFKQGKYKDARKQIEKALKWADPEDKGIIFEHYGDVLLKLDEKEKAREAYQSAIEYGEDESRINEKISDIPE